MLDFIWTLLADPTINSTIAGAIGGAFVMFSGKATKWIKAYVLKTETKVDDNLLAAVLAAIEKKRNK